MRASREGQPIPGSAGTISAADQAAALGLDAAAPPKPAPLPLTPEQARRAMSGKDVGDGPPDFEASVVSDPAAIAGALGLTQTDFEPTTPPGYRDGDPLPTTGVRLTPEAKSEGTNWGAIDAAREAATSDSAAEVSRPLASAEADELRAQYRAHVEKITAMAEAARGDATKEAKAAAEVRASAELGERLKAKLGGNL